MTERRATGVFLTPTGAEAALVEKRSLRRRPKVTRADVDAPAPVWENDAENAPDLFAKLATALPGVARRADCPMRIALPDPLVTEERLTFAEFPEDKAEATSLLAWRYGRDYQKDHKDLAVSYQILGQDGDQTQVLLRVASGRLIDRIANAALLAGFWVDRIDGWSGFWPDGEGARLWTDDNWWALDLTAETGDGVLKSGWHDTGKPDAATPARIAKSFALNTGQNALGLATLSRGATSDVLQKMLLAGGGMAASETPEIISPAETIAGLA